MRIQNTEKGQIVSLTILKSLVFPFFFLVFFPFRFVLF